MQDETAILEQENHPENQDENNKAYRFKHPFQFEGNTISEVNLREMTAGDLMAVEREAAIIRKARGYVEPAGDIENTGYIVARYTGLTIDAVEMMHPGDFMALSGKVQDFLS